MMRESTIGMIEKTTPPCAYDWYKKLGEAFKQNVEDSLKGENIMASNTKYVTCGEHNEVIMDQEMDIHLTAIRSVVLDIRLKAVLEQQRFLKQALIDYADRGEYDISNELSRQLINLEAIRKDTLSDIDEITDEYGHDMRYRSRSHYLAAIHEDIMNRKTPKEDAEPPAREDDPKPPKGKTKKSDGNAD